jgi:hypothetical protein
LRIDLPNTTLGKSLILAPWTIDAAIAVRDKTTAAQLERYLKSGSGRAFANKHLFATSSVKTAKGVKQD